MKPFQLLRNRGGANPTQKNSAVVSSSGSNKAALSSRLLPHKKSAPSNITHRGRSLEQREETPTRRRSRSKSEQSQSNNRNSSERLGGFVVRINSGGKNKQSSSDERDRGRAFSQEQQQSKQEGKSQSRSRNRRTRSRSRERSPSLTRNNLKSKSRNHEMANRQNDNSIKSNVSTSISQRKKCNSVGPTTTQSSVVHRAPAKKGERRTITPPNGSIASGHQSTTKPVSETRPKGSPSPPAIDKEPNNTSRKKSRQPDRYGPSKTSTALDTKRSAFQPAGRTAVAKGSAVRPITSRWPRLPSFRRKKLQQDIERGKFELDPIQRQRILKMILGNDGSMFEEQSTLNAPRGQVMNDPYHCQQRNQQQQQQLKHNQRKRDESSVESQGKTCSDRIVDIGLCLEAISASPFICIQTVCCVQEDYLEQERLKLASKVGTSILPKRNISKPSKAKVVKSTSLTNPDGPPKIIKVVPREGGARDGSKRQDAPSASVFTTGTAGSHSGLRLPCGFERYDGSVGDEPDDRHSGPELEPPKTTELTMMQEDEDAMVVQQLLLESEGGFQQRWKAATQSSKGRQAARPNPITDAVVTSVSSNESDALTDQSPITTNSKDETTMDKDQSPSSSSPLPHACNDQIPRTANSPMDESTMGEEQTASLPDAAVASYHGPQPSLSPSINRHPFPSLVDTADDEDDDDDKDNDEADRYHPLPSLAVEPAGFHMEAAPKTIQVGEHSKEWCDVAEVKHDGKKVMEDSKQEKDNTPYPTAAAADNQSGQGTKSRGKLHEWEAMEAELKVILQTPKTDDHSIHTL